MDPLPPGERWTNDKLGRAVEQLHDCHEATDAKVDKTYSELRELRHEGRNRETKRQAEMGEVKGQLAGLSTQVQSMMLGFGLRPDEAAAGTVRRPESKLTIATIATIIGATSGLQLLLKIWDAAWPSIHQAIVGTH